METLRYLRKRIGWNQRELSERLGVDRTAIAKYESGETDPSLSVAFRMADLFGLSLDELFGRKPLSSDLLFTGEPEPTPDPEPPEDPDYLLAIHELKSLSPAERQRVYDFMSGMRAQRDLSRTL